jgi:uncharacterized protein
MKKILLGAIKLYQLHVSPMFGAHCRYTPSCSVYAREALTRHGALKGLWRASKRVLRCHPFHVGGYDPVTE